MKTRERLVASLAIFSASLLALTACSGGTQEGSSGDTGDSKELTSLTVATIGLTSDGSLLAGMEQGFFEEEGLRIETSIVANPPAGLAAVQSGQVDIAYSPSIPLLNALSQGVPIQVIGAADGYPEDALSSGNLSELDDTGFFASATSGITSVGELEGKTIASSAP